MINRRRLSRKEKGITLVALVVTIIVLLILAGVTISLVLGQNGVIDKAKESKTVMDEAQIKEELQLAIHALQPDYHTGTNTGTFRDYIFSSESGKGQEKLKAELGASNLSFDTANNQIVYKGITYNVAEDGTITKAGAASNSGGGTTQTEETYAANSVKSLAQAGIIKRGDTVNYNPGTATTASITLPAGAELSDTISASSATDWVVFDVNETTGEVLILPRTLSETDLTLRGVNGYNNGIEAVDAVASIYKNPDFALSSRSLRLEHLAKLVDDNSSPFTEQRETLSWTSRYGMNSDETSEHYLDITDAGEEITAEQNFTCLPMNWYGNYDTGDYFGHSWFCWLANRAVLYHEMDWDQSNLDDPYLDWPESHIEFHLCRMNYRKSSYSPRYVQYLG